MPLIERCNIESFRENIRISVREGKPVAQAVAIAKSTLERTCKKEGKPVPEQAQLRS